MSTTATDALLRFVRRWFDERTVGSVFEPLLADHQREWFDAPAAARRRIAARTALSFAIALVTLLPRAVVAAPTPAAITRRVIARMISFISVASLLMAVPFLTELRRVPPGRLAWLFALLLPSMIVLAFPFAMGFVVDGIRRSAAPTPAERIVLLRTAAVGVAFMVLFGGWLVPAANQQFRATVMSERWLTPTRGARELSTAQLLANPEHALVAEGRGLRVAVARELHNRASLALLPLVLIWLRWRALGDRSPQWLLPAWLSATVTIGGYFFMRENDLWLESLLDLGPGAAAWAPLAVFLVLGWIRDRARDLTVTSLFHP
jgi:hypothetical protein